MNILYQTPYPGSPLLLSSLAEAAQGATAAGASFAYATRDGVELFFAEPAIRAFADAAPLDLVIGLDAITDLKALEALDRAAARHTLLSVSLFLNPLAGRSFHPKATWFRHPDGGTTITGSGNLTKGGLKRNWEAFSREQCDSAAIAQVEAQWTQWKTAHAGALRGLANPEARDRAALNRVVARAVERISRLSQQAAEQTLATIPVAAGSDGEPFLAAELIRNRLTQPNFRKADFIDFFGVPVPGNKQLTVYRVHLDGSFSASDTVTAFSTGPRNYRFKARAMAGVPYPTAGKPIALVERVDTATFKYMILLPGEYGQGLLQNHLNATAPAGPYSKSARMSRIALEQVWPDCPML